MQQALRPYVTTGVAVLGAGAIAVAPIAPPAPTPSIESFAIELTAGLDLGQIGVLVDPTNPFEVYPDLVTNSFGNLSHIFTERFSDLDNAFPILEAIASNQFGYLQDFIGDPTTIINVPGQMFGHAGDVFQALTSFVIGVEVTGAGKDAVVDLLDALKNPSWGSLLDFAESLWGVIQSLGSGDLLNIGIDLPTPIVMGLAGLGPLVNMITAFSASVGAFTDAMGDSDYLGALGALVSAPGYIGDTVLNGQLGLAMDLGPLGEANLPLLNGILQPIQDAHVGLLDNLVNLNVGPFTGLFDGFVNYLPNEIADALTSGSTGSGNILGGLGFDSLTGIFDNLSLDSLTGVFDGLGADNLLGVLDGADLGSLLDVNFFGNALDWIIQALTSMF